VEHVNREGIYKKRRKQSGGDESISEAGLWVDSGGLLRQRRSRGVYPISSILY